MRLHLITPNKSANFYKSLHGKRPSASGVDIGKPVREDDGLDDVATAIAMQGLVLGTWDLGLTSGEMTV